MKYSTLNSHGKNRFTGLILQASSIFCLALLVSIVQVDPAQAARGRPGGGGWGGGGAGDTTAPTVPSGVTATAASSSQINLSWKASSDSVGVKGYKVYRSGSQIATVTGTSFSNTGLSASKSYSYTVSAYDAAGNTSAQSGSVSATTLASDGGGGGGGGDTSACNANMANFKLSGDPASNSGATWTYASTDGGVSYNLKGFLFKPTTGSGPFPGGIASHGSGGTAPVEAGKKFQEWGMVGIGTNYTHSSDKGGSPTGEDGASTANIQRAHKTWDILCGLGYVDMKRVVAHGHSMGAFVTAALVGSYPNDFKAASHTAGGVSDKKLPTWTSSALANGIKVPYQMHHGDKDSMVPLADDQTLDGILAAKGVTRELKVYAGYSHSDVRTDTKVMDTIKSWYTKYGVFSSTATASATASTSTSTSTSTASSTLSASSMTDSGTTGASLGMSSADSSVDGAAIYSDNSAKSMSLNTAATSGQTGTVSDSSLPGNIYYVSPNGSDGNIGTSPSKPLETINAGLDKAASGDTIYVMTGTYVETVNIVQSGITLSAYADNKPVIDGQTTLPGDDLGSLMTVDGDNNIISGFELINSGFNGIEVSGHKNTISKMNVHDIREEGILINGDNNIVEDSKVW